MTPEELRSVTFEKTMRGYRCEDVDDLVEEPANALAQALAATAEAEATATFVKEQVSARFPEVRITRLAQGIPLGAEVKYMDRETLRQSLRYRQAL